MIFSEGWVVVKGDLGVYWVVVSAAGSVFTWTMSGDRSTAINKYVVSYQAYSTDWKKCYRNGYRCVKCKLVAVGKTGAEHGT